MADTQFTFHLLGTFQLSRAVAADEPVVLRRKTRALLAYLATADQSHTRQTLMDLFCLDAMSPSRALSVLLSRIRHHLGKAAIITHGSSIQLNRQLAGVDYAVFQQQLSGDLSQKSVADIETAVSLYRGEFLEGLTLPNAPEFELWLLGQRAHAHQLLERGLFALIQRLSQRDGYDTAVQYARQLLQYNPLLEDGHAWLIWLYAQTGQREAALRQYDQCRLLLQAELGVAPTIELQKLQAAIVSGALARPLHRVETAVLPTSPSLASDFVGRAAPYGQLQSAWHSAQAGQGVALLIGAPAGGGKTRLVQELIRHLPQTTTSTSLSAGVYVGGCYESTRTLPYQPWLEILEDHLQQLDDAALQQLPPATQAYLCRLLPAMARRLPQTAAAASDVIDEPERLFTAVFG